ncbi:hypothetical protein D3P96_08195 [Weissella viridescens]|uniref:Uncharacterized protein n=1 Tax=Weissella viridescens TaxID=1629 RepID=A0A3P2RI02_WEIVI|nr:hypothetical protein [Weissella viridescens]RRG17342.1 hypothetical protein D3P96_08195 [Weissella viridescens]
MNKEALTPFDDPMFDAALVDPSINLDELVPVMTGDILWSPVYLTSEELNHLQSLHDELADATTLMQDVLETTQAKCFEVDMLKDIKWSVEQHNHNLDSVLQRLTTKLEVK